MEEEEVVVVIKPKQQQFAAPDTADTTSASGAQTYIGSRAGAISWLAGPEATDERA